MTAQNGKILQSQVSKRQFLKAGATVSVTAAGTLWIGSAFGATSKTPSVEDLRKIDPKAYPSLSRVEFGLLDYQHRKATAKLGDWSLWEPSNTFGQRKGLADLESEGTQYDLFTSTVAVSHAVNKTPAYREFAETVLGGIAEKGFDDRNWRYWTENRSGSKNDGSSIPYSPDPVMAADAMYVGNMVGTLGYYALMTGNLRFNEKRPYTYNGPGVEIAGTTIKHGTTWEHSWKDVLDSLAQQMTHAHHRMVMCEMPSVYFICNLPIAQGLLAYDKVAGGSYSELLYGKGGFFETTGDEMFVPPRSSGQPIKSVAFGQKLTDGKWNSMPASPIGDVFLPYGLMPTKPDWARDSYQLSRNQWLRDKPDGLASWGLPPLPDGREMKALNAVMTSLGAVTAGFMNDGEAHRRTMDFIDRTYAPTWDGDTLVYKMGYETTEEYQQAGVMQALILLANAAAEGSPMANFDIDRARFTEPTLIDAPYPKVKVRTATFDRQKSALVLGMNAERPTTVGIANLKPGSKAVVLTNGGEPRKMTVPSGPGGLRINVPAGDHSFVIGVHA